MKPAPFEYHRPRDIDEIVALLSSYGEECRILAGGQSLVPLMNMRMLSPKAIVSINHCAVLDRIEREGNGITIGAGSRQEAVGRSDLVRRHCRLLHRTMPLVGTRANRNRGTVCGSLAHYDPSAELPVVAMALDAEFTLHGKAGRRRVAAAEFFVSELTTCIEPGEYLEEVAFPLDPANAGAAFAEAGVRAHGFAIAGVAARVVLDAQGGCLAARVAGLGIGDGATRLRAVEAAASGRRLDEAALTDLGRIAEESVDPPSDPHADADYRRSLAGALTVRALREAVADAGRA